MSEAQRNEGPIDRIVGRMEEAYLRTVAELQRLARNAPHVTQEWVRQVASMDPMEMRRRLFEAATGTDTLRTVSTASLRFATSAVVELTVAGRTRKCAPSCLIYRQIDRLKTPND